MATQLPPVAPAAQGGGVPLVATKPKSSKARRRLLKASDPFAEQNSLLRQDMAKGLDDILELHNPVEMSSLCGSLGIDIDLPIEEMKAEVRRYVQSHKAKENGTHVERNYHEVLKVVWEGVLFEYLRSVGQPLHSNHLDPRTFVARYWKKRATDPKNRLFVPYYTGREVRNCHENGDYKDDDLEMVLDDVETKEITVKKMETIMRKERDYRHILNFLNAVKELRDAEKSHRDYLILQVEKLRSVHGHWISSQKIMEEQTEELEQRLAAFEDNYVFDLAAREASVENLGRLLAQKTSENLTLVQAMLAFARRHTPIPTGSANQADAGDNDASVKGASTADDESALITLTDSQGGSQEEAGEDDSWLQSIVDDFDNASKKVHVTESLQPVSQPPPPDVTLSEAFAHCQEKFDIEVEQRNDVILNYRADIAALQEQLAETHRFLQHESKRADDAEQELKETREGVEDLLEHHAENLAEAEAKSEFLFSQNVQMTGANDDFKHRITRSAAAVEKLLVSADAATQDIGWEMFSELGFGESGEALKQAQERVAMHFEEKAQRDALSGEKGGKKKKGKSKKGKKGKGGGKKGAKGDGGGRGRSKTPKKGGKGGSKSASKSPKKGKKGKGASKKGSKRPKGGGDDAAEGEADADVAEPKRGRSKSPKKGKKKGKKK